MTFEWLSKPPLGRVWSGPDKFLNNFNDPTQNVDPKYQVKIPGAGGAGLTIPPIEITMSSLEEKPKNEFTTRVGDGRPQR